MPHSDRCVNPYNIMPHQGKCLRKFTNSMSEEFPLLSKQSKVCAGCRIIERKQKKISRNDSPPNDNNMQQNHKSMGYDVSENAQNDNSMGFDVPENAQNGDLIKNNVPENAQSFSDEELEYTSTRENELEEMLTGLKDKFSSLDRHDPLKLSILSIAPLSWSARKIQKEFDTSRYLSQKAKKLRLSFGVLPSTTAKAGKTLPKETVQKVKDFYENDENSRIMPGKKDSISVRIDGQRKTVQKRLLLLDLSDLYTTFTEKYKKIISFSAFAKLRPKHCILAGARGTHSVCVCTIHENCKMMLEAINIGELTDKQICDYKDCLNKLVCENPTPDCYLNNCNDCPGIADFSSYLLDLLNEKCITEIQCSFWTGTDRSTLQTVSFEVNDFVDELCTKLEILKPHSFIAKQQSEFINNKKSDITESEVLVMFDFSENYAYTIQNASQAFHFNNDQCTVFPVIYYYKEGSEIKHESCVFLSDSLKHDTAAVYAIQTQLIPKIKKRVKNVKKIIYETDGAKQHFKNRFQMANLLHHKKDFGIEAEWHYSATAHGKSCFDGIGALFKREAYRCSLLARPENAINSFERLLSWAQNHFMRKKIKIFFFNKNEHNRVQRKLNKRFEEAKPVTGISLCHAFSVVDDNALFMKKYSYAKKRENLCT